MQQNIVILSYGKDSGRTTISVNLASMLVAARCSVLVVDANVTSPSATDLIGVFDVKHTYSEVLTKKIDITNAIIPGRNGWPDVISSRFDKSPSMANSKYITKLAQEVQRKCNYDFVVFDIGPEIVSFDDWSGDFSKFIVVSPAGMLAHDLYNISITSSKKLKLANILLNKLTSERFEVMKYLLAEMFKGRLIAAVHIDPIVQVSEKRKLPVCVIAKNSQFSKEMADLVDFVTKTD